MAENNSSAPLKTAEGAYPALPEPVDQVAQADGFNVIGTADVFTAGQMRAYAAQAVAAQAPAAVAVPDGWKLVPIEPQPEQLDSAIATDRDGTPASYKTLYIAMVGAALTPPIFAAQAEVQAEPVHPGYSKVIAITTAYEQGVGKGHDAHQRGAEIANPYCTSDYQCFEAWRLGYKEGKTQATRKAEVPDMTVADHFPHEQMDALALARYKVVPSDQSMYWRHAVVAGDGQQHLYNGREVDCQNMARKFAGAFLDGAFAFHSLYTAPQAQPTPALPATEPARAAVGLTDALRDLIKAIEYTPLGIRQIKALERARAAIKTEGEIPATEDSSAGDLAADAHPDDAAVDALAAKMKAKLAKQRAKGYGGWDTFECTQQRLSDMLRDHVAKGDPVDVANFCAFLTWRDEGISEEPQAEPKAWLHQVVAADGEPDQALSFAPDNFPLAGVGGFRSIGVQPLYTARQSKAEVQEQVQPYTVDFDAIVADIQAIDTRHRGDPSYEHDPVWVRSKACDVVRRHACLSAAFQPQAEVEAEPVAKPPGIEALMCVISSLRDTGHISDEEGELTNDLRALRDWAQFQRTAPQAEPVAKVLGWVRKKNGEIGSHFFTYEPHCDCSVRDNGGEKIAVIAATAPQAQPADALDAEALLTHRAPWRDALVQMTTRGLTSDDAEQLYWRHELKAFDEAFAALRAQQREGQ